MKKLLLITFLFLITPDAKADMDYVCEVHAGLEMFNYIEDTCERNNILNVYLILPNSLYSIISDFCRYDRQVHYKLENNSKYTLTCVLYDKKARRLLGYEIK